MSFNSYDYLLSFFFKNALLSLLLGLLFSYMYTFLKYKKYFQIFSRNDYNYNISKFITVVSLLCSYVFFIMFMYNYIEYYNKLNTYYIFYSYSVIPHVYMSSLTFLSFEFSFDFFGLVLLFLAYFVGILSLMVLDTRFLYKNCKYLNYINFFTILVFLFVCTNNLLLLFLFYEFLLLPSVILVYYISPSRRAIQATLYFIIWTQIGSFFVLCVVSYIIMICGSSNFYTIRGYNFSSNETYFLYLVLFLGFGFKVPIWPFHYWLTKTHVEAPSGFSMYLSGFLVKSALYGFYKISNLFGAQIDTTIFSTICVVGVIDASLKMWGQTDLKKLVAYGTIQEMNLIYLTLCWGDSYAVIGGILFCITHAALSTLMFFIVDCIQKRFNSRNLTEISGILQLTPNLGITIILMCVLYAGLPNTLKFTCEFYIFSGLLEISLFFTAFLMFTANVLGLVGFSKCWFNAVFGINLKHKHIAIFDLSLKELLIIGTACTFLIMSTFLSNYFF